MKKVFYGALALATFLCSIDTYANTPIETEYGKPVQQDVLPVNEVLQAIPSPLEISVLIKETGTIYNKSDLNDPNSVSKYNTTYKKALNLGIYGSDLGFANIYGKNQDALSFLNSVKNLADGLGIGAFFDYETIKKLAESSGKLDELIQTTTLNFEKINTHLRERKRENISALVLTGGWVESLYLITVVNQNTPSDVLEEKIADQKVILEQLILVLDVYKTKPGFADLIKDLTALQGIYDQIEVEVTIGEPEMKEAPDGSLIVVDGSKTTINYTANDIQRITSLLKSIRNKMIQ